MSAEDLDDEEEYEDVDFDSAEDVVPAGAVQKMRYRCTGGPRKKCTHEAEIPWIGRCPSCGGLWAIRKSGGSRRPVKTAASLAQKAQRKFIPTGIAEVDKVLGGGIIRGCSYLFGGPPGTGKSTLLYQVCVGVVADEKRTALYAGDEMDDDDVADIIRRVGGGGERVRVLASTGDVERVLEVAEEMEPRPTVLVVDSLQTATLPDVDAAEGSTTQVDACANRITSWAKRKKVACFLICHVNSVGEFKGTTSLRHLVDALVYFEPDWDEDKSGDVCCLSLAGKNRKGPRNAEAHLRMSDDGKLVPYEQRSKIVRLPKRGQ